MCGCVCKVCVCLEGIQWQPSVTQKEQYDLVPPGQAVLRGTVSGKHLPHSGLSLSLSHTHTHTHTPPGDVPRSSATGWECWAGVSAHTPPFSSPPLKDRTVPGHGRAAGSLHRCLTGNTNTNGPDIGSMRTVPDWPDGKIRTSRDPPHSPPIEHLLAISQNTRPMA